MSERDLPATREYERACKQRVAEATQSTYGATRVEYTAGEMHDELLACIAELEAELAAERSFTELCVDRRMYPTKRAREIWAERGTK